MVETAIGSTELPVDESAEISDEDSVDHERVFVCDYPACSAAFSKPCRLQWHRRVHDGERPFKCDYPNCTASYTRSYHLTRHRNKNHAEKAIPVTVFHCTVKGCKQTLQTRQLLERHLSSYHEGRPFACTVCPKRFRKHKHLTTHEYEHTKIHPHICPVQGCGKGFTVKQKLTRHLKCHDGYACPAEGCHEKFEKWSVLRKHQATAHRKLHLCKFCKKDFPRMGLLKEHLLTHQDTRECFKCPACDSLLVNTEKSIAQHAARCSAKKASVVCEFPECGKVLLRAGNLARHMKLHRNTPGVGAKCPVLLGDLVDPSRVVVDSIHGL